MLGSRWALLLYYHDHLFNWVGTGTSTEGGLTNPIYELALKHEIFTQQSDFDDISTHPLPSSSLVLFPNAQRKQLSMSMVRQTTVIS